MRDELKSDIQRRNYRQARRNVLSIFLVSFIITFNIIFAAFVFTPYDLSPNFVIGLFSLILIIWMVYEMTIDEKELKILNEKNKKNT